VLDRLLVVRIDGMRRRLDDDGQIGGRIGGAQVGDESFAVGLEIGFEGLGSSCGFAGDGS
jgi:hypothetical protein